MINAQHAAQVAIDCVKQLTPDATGVLVDEIEPAEDGATWNVTIGFQLPPDGVHSIESITGGRKEYRVFTIDAESGEVRSMKGRRTM